MSLKLKILGLGVLAVLATSAFTAINASAVVSGHFTHEGETNNATVTGFEKWGTQHQLKFFEINASTGTIDPNKPIECTEATYHGTVTAKTVEEVAVTPTYKNCGTPGEHGTITVTPNGCQYIFRSNKAASTHTPTAHATVTVFCPPNKAIVIKHPNCEITVPGQALKGATYTTIISSATGKHALTVNVTIQHIMGQFHAGICVFLGTNHIFEMQGAVLVEAHNGDAVPKAIPITAT